VIALAVFYNGVLGGEGDAAHDDDNHDERVKERERDDAVDEDAYAAAKQIGFNFSAVVKV
jgi:hypothetical protein